MSFPVPEAAPHSPFICDCEKWMRPACAGEPFYNEYKGKRYCVLHFPGKQKSAEFEKALQRKLDNQDFEFRGVWFPDKVSFYKVHFNSYADFRSAIFSELASFSNCTFVEGAIFYEATFRASVSFTETVFTEAVDFTSTTFKGDATFQIVEFKSKATFNSATFNANVTFSSSGMVTELASGKSTYFPTVFGAEADFSDAVFNSRVRFFQTEFNAGLIFESTTFNDYVSFRGNKARRGFGPQASLDFHDAKLDKPEYLSFHTLTLRPHWFVDADARQFNFTNVDWDWRSTGEEIESLERNEVSSPHRMLETACRYLAVNAEENHRYEEASKFRYMAMDSRRRAKWRGFALWRLSWWYWLASGYGERIPRAFAVLFGVWLLFAALYMQVGFARWDSKVSNEQEAMTKRRDEVGEPLPLPRALTYSLGVMTLQKPEPPPATTAARSVVILETVLGPVQAALLALAIRRKFMR
jgi:Pentapeptide repeats (9 copies)